MPRTKEITLYQFDELSDTAKIAARDWYRQCSDGDNDFAESVIEDAAECAAILGITIDHHPVKLMNGKTRQDPSVWWSGFWSQGDGACFDGSYCYAAGAHRKIRAHAPQDTELHRIADGLLAVQKEYSYSLSASIKHIGHYSHAHSTTITVDRGIGPNEIAGADVEAIETLLRDYMTWIYRELEKEYEYQNADEQVDETIRANEYEFTEDGERA